MDNIISVIAILLILAYVGIAIWVICRRETIAGSIGVAAGFFCGGLVIIPIAVAVATFVCWAVIIVLVLAIIGAIAGG